MLTTYGTLRRDIGHLKDVAFDYAILDEAQAIKNARTSSAKAARLLHGASTGSRLSGTPVENHLGELWSLFEFLNPGILGAASIFTAAGALGHTADQEMLDVLSRGLRPFILRRTKDQVAGELPARTEQTLYCELEPPQRSLVRRAARALPRVAARHARARRDAADEDAGARGAAAAAAGRVPPGPGRPRRARQPRRPSSTC